MLFHLQPQQAIVNDINADVINVYQVVRDYPDALIAELEQYRNTASEFYRLRTLDRDEKAYAALSAVERAARIIYLNAIYTIQQTVGLSLDALPAGASNTARKINGDLFERFIRLVIQELGVPCRAGVMQIPVMLDGEEYSKMSYQHDLIVEGSDGSIQLLGSIKTSSKDRIDTTLIDKFLYSKLTDTVTPHIAVFLNDVQRKKTSQEERYGINSTFLPGHFKGYTVKLNPLEAMPCWFASRKRSFSSSESSSYHSERP